MAWELVMQTLCPQGMFVSFADAEATPLVPGDTTKPKKAPKKAPSDRRREQWQKRVLDEKVSPPPPPPPT